MVASTKDSVKMVAFRDEGFLSDIKVGLDTDGQYKLTIIGVQQTEDGLWHCQQNNQIRKKIRLSVDGQWTGEYSQTHTKQYYSVKPYIDPITTHALQAGDDATLICIAQGQPRPELTWTFKNKTIGKTVNYTLLPFYLEINRTSRNYTTRG